MSTAEIIDKILAEINKLENPRIERSRIEKLSDFFTSAINGDEARECLCINASLGTGKRGAIIYILTNLRLIKVDIDNAEVRSSSYSLGSITSIDRNLIASDRAEVIISFQNDSFGLRYSQVDKNITEFFQKVDQARIPPETKQRGSNQ